MNNTENGVPCKENYIHIPLEPGHEMKFECGQNIFQKMRQNGDSIAQIDSVTGERESYASLLSRSIRIAQAMQAKGLQKEDVVSLCSCNNMDYSATIIASFFTGVLIAALDPAAPLFETVHCLQLITPKILFCATEYEDMIEEAIQKSGVQCEIVIFGDTKSHVPFSDYLLPRGNEGDFKPTPSKNRLETALIVFSSGTSGMPKAVCVNQYALHHPVVYLNRVLTNYKLMLIISNPCWISNVLMLCMAIACNSARLIAKKLDPETVVKTIQDYEVDFTLFAPIACNRFIKNPRFCQYDTSKLKYIVTGGSASSPQQLIKLKALFPHSDIYNSYGMTEVGGNVLIMAKQEKELLLTQERACIGQLMPGYYYKVVDVATERALGPNETGEFRVKTDALMLGYYLQPDVTAAAVDDEGYYKSGDTVYYDEKHKFYYVDRMKEIFKYRSWHISPTIIEAELITHPDVKECVVFGTPHELDGEVPTAAVVLRGAATVNEKEIVKYVNDRIPNRYFLRGGVFFMESLSLTTSGKVRRNDIRKVVMQMIKK